MTEVLRLAEVTKTYRHQRSYLTAVDGVSLTLGSGEILCLVGESGSGKSTIGRLVTGLTDPTGGDILYDGIRACEMNHVELRAHRLAVQLIQQDPYASLNPGLTVEQTLTAPLSRHRRLTPHESRERVFRLLEDVGLTPPDVFARKYPHELSGGQRQRVSIARSLTVEPRVLVADEALSMLDVSIRMSVLTKLRGLCDERQLAVLFITHDLAVASQFGRGHSIAVMQHGQIVEHRPTAELVSHPEHAYTRALLAAARHDDLRSRSAGRAETDTSTAPRPSLSSGRAHPTQKE